MLRAPHQEGEHSSGPWISRPGQAPGTSREEHRTRQKLSSSTRTAGARQERARALPSGKLGVARPWEGGRLCGGCPSVHKGFHASMVERVKGSSKIERKEVKTMGNKHFSDLMNTLECLEMTAADLIDTVASAKAELKQTFEEIEQTTERRASA